MWYHETQLVTVPSVNTIPSAVKCEIPGLRMYDSLRRLGGFPLLTETNIWRKICQYSTWLESQPNAIHRVISSYLMTMRSCMQDNVSSTWSASNEKYVFARVLRSVPPIHWVQDLPALVCSQPVILTRPRRNTRVMIMPIGCDKMVK